MRKVILLFINLFICQFVFAQVQLSNVALVKSDFNTNYYREEFDSSSSDWPTISNYNNLFVVQNGAYYMNRKAKGDPYAVICSKQLNHAAYQLNFKINPIAISQDGYVGVLFMLQESSVGGFIFEIGPNQNYRLRQVNNGIYKNITGDIKSNGWVGLKDVIKYNQDNSITIEFQNRNYDLYINEKRLLSFNDIEYKSGSFGILIGPETKVSIENISIYTDANNSAESTNTTSSSSNDNAEIIKLKDQIEKLENDNDELLNVVETMKSKGYSSPDDFEAKYVSSVANYNSLKLKYDSLVVEYLQVKKESDSLKLVQPTLQPVDKSIDALMLELDELKNKNQELMNENAILNRKLKKPVPETNK